ncbi:MAG TPA: hypothetical protein VFL31_00315 [Nitrospiraceae bacterium]|nr:hypothetical protein [Nitrospiraceae bacterium]
MTNRTPITSYCRWEDRRDALRASPRFAVLVTPMREMVAQEQTEIQTTQWPSA